MVPLIGTLQEFANQKALIRQTAEKVFAEKGARVEYLIGTMIEVPRAALTANEISPEADFFSFGTNDLTQMTFGYSRDDAVKFLPTTSPARSCLRTVRVSGPERELDSLSAMGQSAAERPGRDSRWESAASTEATRRRFTSASRWAWTMFPARPFGFPSPAWPPPRRR